MAARLLPPYFLIHEQWRVSVRLRRQYTRQTCIHLQIVCTGDPGDMDAKPGSQLAQCAVELSLIGRSIARPWGLILIQKHATGRVHGSQPFLQDGVAREILELVSELATQIDYGLHHECAYRRVVGVPQNLLLRKIRQYSPCLILFPGGWFPINSTNRSPYPYQTVGEFPSLEPSFLSGFHVPNPSLILLPEW